MLYADIKSSEEQQRLDAAREAAKEKKWYCRLMIITLSAQKYTVQKLSEMFDLCQATIRNYVHAYNEGGLDQLRPKKAPGRPPKLADWTKAQWDAILARTPNQYERLQTESRQWTFDLLVAYVKAYHDISVCRSSVYHSFRKTGRRTGRSKLRVGSPDPDYVVKRQHVEGLEDLPERGN
jgi:transposase